MIVQDSIDVDGLDAANPEGIADLIIESSDDVWQTVCPHLKFQHPPYAEAIRLRSENFDAWKLYYRYECRADDGLKCLFWEKDPYDELLAVYFFDDISHGMDMSSGLNALDWRCIQKNALSHQTFALINKKL